MKVLLTVLFSFVLLIVGATSLTQAADLTTGMVRLDRQQANSQLAGMLCATPTSTATEGRVKIVFPSDFSVSGSGWSTGTTNIPNGSTAWPGVSFNSTSGDSVTFNSGNISSGTRYCFTFHGGGSTTGGTGDKTGEIQTLTSANSVIDTKMFGVTIQDNDRVSVTGQIAANPTDFEAQLTATNTDPTVPQDTTLTYVLTYGSNLSHTANITVEADWSLGTISGSGSPTVEILDYVVGSASDGYNNTPPVIDTVSRTISWNITAFPGSTTGEAVTFQLRTNSNYTGSSPVSFSVNGRVIGPGTQTPDSTVTKNYQYNPGVTPTSAPVTATPGPGITAAPTPTSVPTASFAFQNISVSGLSDTSATIEVATNQPASAVIRYAANIRNLNRTVTSTTLQASHSIEIPDLRNSTQYYFTVTATNSSGEDITSDIYTFTTAQNSELVPLLQIDSTIITSESYIFNSILLPDGVRELFVVLPTGQPFEFRFTLSNYNEVKRVTGLIKNVSVLGINTEGSNLLAESNIEILEVSPGVFVGRLQTKPAPGNYELLIGVYDFSGNITEQKVATVKVVKSFTVYKKDTNTPIENARVILSIYNSKNKLFQRIVPENIRIKNPAFSEPDGTIQYALPNGRYKAEIEALGYTSKTVEFVIGEKVGEEYPVVYLDTEPFNLFTYLSYYLTTFGDVFNASEIFTENLGTSTRFFDLTAVISLILLILLTLIALKIKTQISFFHMPKFLLFHTKNTLKGKHTDIYEPIKKPNEKVPSRVTSGVENILGFGFELLLFACLFFEVIFIFTFGFVKTLPFITVSIVTFLVWFFYLKQKLLQKFYSR